MARGLRWRRRPRTGGRAGAPGATRRRRFGLLLVLAGTVALLMAARGLLPFAAGLVSGGGSCEPEEGRFLGIHQDRVAVFDGIPDGCRVLRETLDLRAAELPPYQRRALEAGIPFRTETERLQVMEGLGSEASN